jgi:putative ABC transport system substrate-binding protein
MPDVRRRELIALLGGMAAAWPIAARGQQAAIPMVGWLSGQSAGERPQMVDAFRRGLNESGFVEGRNLKIEFRWADYQNDRLSALASDLVSRRVAVIAATGGNNSALAAKASTATIPIVFTSGVDPVKVGLVANLNRPEGNLTGISWFNAELTAKGLGLLHELVPNAAVVALLVNPNSPEATSQPEDALTAARVLGQSVLVFNVTTAHEIDATFPTLVERRVDAVVVGADPFLTARRSQIAVLAARHGLPAISFNRDFAAAGGLMSYGNDVVNAHRQAGVYVSRILKGAKPADLPVEQATKFELVINIRTAKALGLAVPNSMQLLADEVIE